MFRFVILRPFGKDLFKKFVTLYAETNDQALSEAAYIYSKKFGVTYTNKKKGDVRKAVKLMLSVA